MQSIPRSGHRIALITFAALTIACGNGSPDITRPTPTPAPAPSPAPAPAPTPAPAVSMTGVWRGPTRITACEDDGVFEGNCQRDSATQYGATLILTLVQNGATVTGTGEWAYVRTPVTGTAVNARLTNLRGRVGVSDLIEAAFEDWDSTIRGNAMEGTFTIRHYPRQNGVEGGVKYKVMLIGVVRTP